MHIFYKRLITPIRKQILGTTNLLQKGFLRQKLGQDIEFLLFAQKCSKVAPKKKYFFLFFANHPAVHSVEISRGRVHGGGVLVTGDTQYVTHYTLHITRDM